MHITAHARHIQMPLYLVATRGQVFPTYYTVEAFCAAADLESGPIGCTARCQDFNSMLCEDTFKRDHE